MNLREAPSTAPGTCGLPRKCWWSFQAHLLEDLLQSWVTLAHIQGNLEGGGGGREPIASPVALSRLWAGFHMKSFLGLPLIAEMEGGCGRGPPHLEPPAHRGDTDRQPLLSPTPDRAIRSRNPPSPGPEVSWSSLPPIPNPGLTA